MSLMSRDVLASDNEERRVKNGMREEIVRQILNRLRVVPSAGPAVMKIKAEQLQR